MKKYYCWRCEMVVPMLEEHEWEVMEPLLKDQIKKVKNYRAEHGVGIRSAIENVFKPATDKYFEFTGLKEKNHNAIWHHRLANFGKECPECGHLFRTPRASYCVNCGFTNDG